MLTVEKSHSVRSLLDTPSIEQNGVISPDSQWLAYESNDLGLQMHGFVRPFPDVTSGKHLVSTDGGSQPVWPGTAGSFSTSRPMGRS
jgi:hypothetical protein